MATLISLIALVTHLDGEAKSEKKLRDRFFDSTWMNLNFF